MGRRHWFDKRAAEVAVKKRVSNAEILVMLYLVAGTAIATLVIGGLLYGLNRMYGSFGAGDVIVLYPGRVVSFMMGGFIAFPLVWLHCGRVHQWLIGPEPGFFSVDYIVASHPIPIWMKRTAIGVLIFFTGIAVLNIRKHARVGPTSMVEQRALAFFPVSHTYTDARSVTMSHYWVPATKYAPGRLSSRAALFVYFKDGSRWSLRDSELAINDPLEANVAERIAAGAGVAISYPAGVLDVPDQAAIARFDVMMRVLLGIIVFLTALEYCVLRWRKKRHLSSMR